jgi:hypothetical protein
MLKLIVRQCRVASTVASSSRTTDGSSSRQRPSTLKRMSFSARASRSFRTYSLSRFINVQTSKRGRFQFSTEKA